jgi:predicted TPR repeat methyltransferase
MTLADFEALYRRDDDPWQYRSSDYERAKYAATLDACGDGPFRCALELGGSIGVFSAALAPRCRRLVTIDASDTAVRAATDALARFPQAAVLCGEIPDAIPDERYDLVVASEILYYLPEEALRQTLVTLQERMDAGGRLVAVHWRPAGPERPFSAVEIHARLGAQTWLRRLDDRSTDDYLLEVYERA